MPNLSTAPVVETDSAARSLPRWALPAALLAFVFALYAASQIVGVLYALIKPPLPPLLAGANEIAHTSEVYGLDTWAYRVPMLAEDARSFYESQGGECTTAPFSPEQALLLGDQFPDAGTAYAFCEGTQLFSRFTMHWQVLVSYYDLAAADVRLDVARQIDWFGTD